MPLLLIIATLSPLLPLIIGIKKKLTLLWIYILTGFTFDCLMMFLKRVMNYKIYPLGNLFVIIELILIYHIYKPKLFRNKALFFIILIGLELFFITTTISNSIYDFNALGASVLLVSYIILSVAGFFKILQNEQILFIERSSFFWFNSAILIYSAANLLVFLFKDYLVEYDNEFFIQLWTNFFRVISIVKSILFAFALSPKTTEHAYK